MYKKNTYLPIIIYRTFLINIGYTCFPNLLWKQITSAYQLYKLTNAQLKTKQNKIK